MKKLQRCALSGAVADLFSLGLVHVPSSSPSPGTAGLSPGSSFGRSRLPLPFINVVVVLQPTGVERVFFPCRAVVHGLAVGGSLQKWDPNPAIGHIVFEWTPE